MTTFTDPDRERKLIGPTRELSHTEFTARAAARELIEASAALDAYLEDTVLGRKPAVAALRARLHDALIIAREAHQ